MVGKVSEATACVWEARRVTRKGRGDRGCHRLCPFSVPQFPHEKNRGDQTNGDLNAPLQLRRPSQRPRRKLANGPARAPAPRGRTHSPGDPASAAPWRRRTRRIRTGPTWESRSGGKPAMGSGRSSRACDPATRLGRGGDRGEVTGTLTPRDWDPFTPAEEIAPNYSGDTTHASLSHFLWRPEVRGKKRLLRPQGNGTCAEALLMPRNPRASSLRIGRKLVSTQLPRDRSDNSAAPAGKKVVRIFSCDFTVAKFWLPQIQVQGHPSNNCLGLLSGFLPWRPYLRLGYLEPFGLFGPQFIAVK